MHIEFVGRNYTVTPKQRAYVKEYLQRIFPMIPAATGARIVLGVDKYRHIAEVELLGPAGDFVARCEGNDIDQALHDALQRVEQQLIRSKERDHTIRSHKKPVTAADAEATGVAEAINAQ